MLTAASVEPMLAKGPLRARHMEPDYHQLEFDTRLWLTAVELP